MSVGLTTVITRENMSYNVDIQNLESERSSVISCLYDSRQVYNI